MKSQENLKTLFNELFPSLKGNDKKPDVIAKEFSYLVHSAPEDELIKIIHLFFYPSESSQEQNTEKEFWFEKYYDPNNYTEYSFALDLIKILIDYRKNKNRETANGKIGQIPKKFGAYKNIDYYLFLTSSKMMDILIHMYCFFHKDIDYFKSFFKVEVKHSDDLTNKETIENLFLGKTITEIELRLYKANISLDEKVRELMEKDNKRETLMKDMSSKIEDMSTKLEKIYLRDTLKYTIKYLYRLFWSKYGNNSSFKNKIYDQIKELKVILEKPELCKYSFLSNFLSAIEFGDLSNLNKETHPSFENRNFDNIKKYVDNNQPYLDKVVDFLKKFPDLSDYINLEVNYYFNKEELEKKIKEKYDFPLIYNSIIDNNSN